ESIAELFLASADFRQRAGQLADLEIRVAQAHIAGIQISHAFGHAQPLADIGATSPENRATFGAAPGMRTGGGPVNPGEAKGRATPSGDMPSRNRGLRFARGDTFAHAAPRAVLATPVPPLNCTLLSPRRWIEATSTGTGRFVVFPRFGQQVSHWP